MFALEQRRGKLNKIKEKFMKKKNYIFKDKTQFNEFEGRLFRR